jgi:hypothetical protein
MSNPQPFFGPLFPFAENLASREMLVSIVKQQSTDSMGLELHEQGSGQICISKISDGSPFHSTEIKVGQTLISVNGQKVSSCARAIELIQGAEPGNQLFLRLVTKNPKICHGDFSIIYQTSLLVDYQSPPVYFGACRGGALVRILSLLENEDSCINVGDIVLAVNGDAVSHSAVAYNMMLQSVAECSQNQVKLYCIDIANLYSKLLRQYPQITHHVEGDIELQKCQSSISYGLAFQLRARLNQYRGPFTVTLRVNGDSLYLEDCHENRNLKVESGYEIGSFLNQNVVFQERYANTVQPFLRKFNLFLERELRHLEVTVIRQAWIDSQHHSHAKCDQVIAKSAHAT